ncbi:MAG: hypothetical protein Q4C56_05300 [Peptococcaceae bacterium]|nr:hypothetical protein [Peptococcaceae bacterium]
MALREGVFFARSEFPAGERCAQKKTPALASVLDGAALSIIEITDANIGLFRR